MLSSFVEEYKWIAVRVVGSHYTIYKEAGRERETGELKDSDSAGIVNSSPVYKDVACLCLC